MWEVLENIQYSTYWNWGRKYNSVCVSVSVCNPSTNLQVWRAPCWRGEGKQWCRCLFLPLPRCLSHRWWELWRCDSQRRWTPGVKKRDGMSDVRYQIWWQEQTYDVFTQTSFSFLCGVCMLSRFPNDLQVRWGEAACRCVPFNGPLTCPDCTISFCQVHAGKGSSPLWSQSLGILGVSWSN